MYIDEQADLVNERFIEDLEWQFDEALNTGNFTEAKKIISQARDLSLGILVQSLESKLKEAQWKIDEQSL